MTRMGKTTSGGLAALSAALWMMLGMQAASAQQDIGDLLGAPVFAADGSEIGEVAAVAVSADGSIREMRVSTASPLGFGVRMVLLPPGRYTAARGAVRIDLSAQEFDVLVAGSR